MVLHIPKVPHSIELEEREEENLIGMDGGGGRGWEGMGGGGLVW